MGPFAKYGETLNMDWTCSLEVYTISGADLISVKFLLVSTIQRITFQNGTTTDGNTNEEYIQQWH